MRRLVLLMLAAAVACSDGGGSSPVPPPPTPTIAVSLAPAAGTVERGSGITTTVTVVRGGGYTGLLTLSAAGVPNGVSVTFSPATLSGPTASAVATITAEASATTGTYPITVTANGDGVPSATATVPLTVTARPMSDNVNWTFCDPTTFPIWFAYQNGANGTWTRVTPTGTSTRNYAFTIDSVGALAFARNLPGGEVLVAVYYRSQSRTDYTAPQECAGTPATRTLTGAVAGLGPGQAGLVFVGGSGASAFENGPITIAGVSAGTTDLFAYRSAIDSLTFEQVLERVILRRNVSFATSITPTLDFAGGDSFASVSVPYTIANRYGDPINVATEFLTTNGTAGRYSTLSNGLSDTITVFGIPPTTTAAGDLHRVEVSASSVSGSRVLMHFTRNLVARTLTLGAPLDVPTITTLGSAPYTRVSARGSWQTDYDDGVNITYTQASGNGNMWILSMPRSYGGARAPAWTLTMPDFSGVAGFNAAWGVGTGPLRISVAASGGASASGPSNGAWRDGDVLRSAARTVIVP